MQASHALSSLAYGASCLITAMTVTVTRWEHEHILEAVQRRLEAHLEKIRRLMCRDDWNKILHHITEAHLRAGHVRMM